MNEAYKSTRRTGGERGSGVPAQSRELRAQGRKTMRRLLDAGMRVFADRGFHAARVDDIVRAARTSHGTFYLYFTNKEDLLRALATECGLEIERAGRDARSGGTRRRRVRRAARVPRRFFATYRRYGPVIRAWMEGHVEDRAVSALGVRSFTEIATALDRRMREAGVASDDASISALMALLERFAYFIVSRRLDFDSDAMLDTVTLIVHRGFFAAPVALPA